MNQSVMHVFSITESGKKRTKFNKNHHQQKAPCCFLGEQREGSSAFNLRRGGGALLQILVGSTPDVGNLHLITTNASDCCFAF